MAASACSAVPAAWNPSLKQTGAMQRIPRSRVIYVNKLDRIGADFYRVVKQVEDVLGARPLVMTLPIGIEDDFKGIVDVLTQKAWIWDDSVPENYEITDIPDDMVEKAADHREALIESALEQDDDLMEAYLESGEEPPWKTLSDTSRGHHRSRLVPTCCGTCQDKGVQNVLDAVVDYLPSPTRYPPSRKWTWKETRPDPWPR